MHTTKSSFKVWILSFFAFCFIIVGIISMSLKYTIKYNLIQDTSKAVSDCLNGSYHSQYETTDISYDGTEGKKYTNKDVDPAKCEKIRDVMLSIY